MCARLSGDQDCAKISLSRGKAAADSPRVHNSIGNRLRSFRRNVEIKGDGARVELFEVDVFLIDLPVRPPIKPLDHTHLLLRRLLVTYLNSKCLSHPLARVVDGEVGARTFANDIERLAESNLQASS